MFPVVESDRNLTVQYALRPADVYDPFWYSWRNVIRWATVVLVCLLVYEAGPGWSSAYFGITIKPTASIPVLIGASLFILFLLPWLRVQAMFRKYPALGRLRSVSLGTEGLHAESDDARGDYKWSIFRRVVETPKVFVFMATSRAGTYLPKRCLATRDEVVKLRRLIRENFSGQKTLLHD